jgi:hypothetical protein
MARVSLCSSSAKFSSAEVARAAPPPTPPGPPSAEFAGFYRRHRAFVRKVLRRRGVGGSDVEDLCQEVFLLAFRKWEGLTLGPARGGGGGGCVGARRSPHGARGLCVGAAGSPKRADGDLRGREALAAGAERGFARILMMLGAG